MTSERNEDPARIRVADRRRIENELVADALLGERIRAAAIGLFAAIGLVIYDIGVLFPGNGMFGLFQAGLQPWLPLGLLAGLGVYSALAWWLVVATRRAVWSMAMLALVEGLLPTMVLLVLTQFMDPLGALTMPPLLLYALFIMLSALRLQPGLTLFTAGVAAISYVWLALSVVPLAVGEAPSILSLPVQHVAKGLILLVEGAVMAWTMRRLTHRAVHGALASIDKARALEAAEIRARSAEAANVAKSAFLANMSHELRTPINAVLGYAELAAEELEDGEIDGSLRSNLRIQTAGKHLLRLINDVLDLSKIEAGGLELEAAPFDLSALCEAVTAELRPAMEESGTTLVTVGPPEQAIVVGDDVRVRQVLINLLSNANKFAAGGRVELDISRDPDAEDGWEFRVCDDGIGMTEAQLDRVWDRFAQADDSTTRRFGGTGLGLTITRRLVDVMQGSIEAVSAPGEGSTFTVRLPLPEAADEAREVRPRSVARSA